MPPCRVRQHWRRHQRAGLERVVGKQGRGTHYKRRMKPEERQNISTTAERGAEKAGDTERERPDAIRMKT